MALSLIRSDSQRARIAPLARLPVFFKLDGRRALVAGTGATACWKIELIAAAGAAVDVYAPDPTAELLAVAGAVRGRVNIHARAWAAADFNDAAIAVGACDDDGEAARFAAAAHAAGVPVNVIDKPAFSDFAFGAIVNRSPLVIGISTDGAAPVFAQAIRARLETLIPHGFARWAAAAARWRPRVQAFAQDPEKACPTLDAGWGPVFGKRSCAGNNLERDDDSEKSHPAPGRAFAVRFWKKFAGRAIARADVSPREADLEALLAETSGERPAAPAVVVATPDDPELMSLRAMRALQSAEVILFDDDIGTGILDFARREARRMLVGPGGGALGDAANKQGDHAASMIALARAGRCVVRLVGGEAGIARAEAEIAACRAAGVAVELIAGLVAGDAPLHLSPDERDRAAKR